MNSLLRDSRGPNFLGGSSTISATTVTGDAVCPHRSDTRSARTFLRDFLRLP